MPVRLLIIRFPKDIKQLMQEINEPYAIAAFERFEVVEAAIPQLS